MNGIPDVKSTVKIGGFTLYVYAFRPITKTEARLAAGMWLKASKKRKVPKSGSGEVVTIFGFDE